MKRIKNLRDYIFQLNDLGDIVEISREVDAYLEMAAITRRSYDLCSPAPIFNNIKGKLPGLRAMGAPASLSSLPEYPAARVALSVGLDHTATWTDIVKSLAQSKHNDPVPPILVDTAPCKQNILHGKEADLDKFPIPFLHQEDGGEYSNTWGTIVARTPDGKWTNWSIARIQKLDGKHMTGLILMPQHIAMVWEEWRKIGKPMPYALVQGCEPALPIVSSMPLGDWVDEADYLGGHFGEAIEVVRCETIDLEVPASSELVIEGHISTEERAKEGPFGEYAGYAVKGTSMQPIYTVECITYRDEAIWPFIPEGRPVDEFHTAVGVAMCAEILDSLNQAGLPVTMAWSPLETAVHWLIITVPNNWRERLPNVSSEEFTKRIGEKIWNTKYGPNCPMIYVMDDDIDPTNYKDVLWGMATRVHPTRHRVESFGEILPLLNCYDTDECHDHHAIRVAHDCLQPALGDGRLNHSSFAGAYPEELQKKVIANWE